MPADPADLRRAITAVALRQAGYFTASQAVTAGYSYQAQKYHVDRGSWIRVDRGVFRLPDWPAREDDNYVLWQLWSRGRGVVSHVSALCVHHLGNIGASRVHLTVPPGFRASDPSVALHKGLLKPVEVENRSGYRVTTVERTLLDAAAMEIGQEQLDVAVAQALDRGLISAYRFRASSEKFSDRAALRAERALGAITSSSTRKAYTGKR